MIKSFDCAWSQFSKRVRNLLKDDAGGTTMEMAYSVSGAGWVAMIGILLLDRAYGFGIQNFSANLLQAVVIF